MIGRSSRARHRTVTVSNRGDLTRPQTQQQLNERFTVSLLPPKEVALSDNRVFKHGKRAWKSPLCFLRVRVAQTSGSFRSRSSVVPQK